jgi:hypothetical protein
MARKINMMEVLAKIERMRKQLNELYDLIATEVGVSDKEKQPPEDSFEQLKNLPQGFRISTEYPYVMMKPNGKIWRETLAKSGLLQLTYKQKTLYKHKIIAEQWKENPEGYKTVIHLNGDPTDNHIENLEWSYDRRSDYSLRALEVSKNDNKVDENKVDENEIEDSDVMNLKPQQQWVECVSNPKYEMQVEYPHYMRYRDTKFLMREETRRGVIYVECDGNFTAKHRLIAQQFVENPENKEIVIHKNGNTTDNHIENLDWITKAEQGQLCRKAASKMDLFDQRPDNLIDISDIEYSKNKHKFKDLYFDGETMWNYKPSVNKWHKFAVYRGSCNVKSIEGKPVAMSVRKVKQYLDYKKLKESIIDAQTLPNNIVGSFGESEDYQFVD